MIEAPSNTAVSSTAAPANDPVARSPVEELLPVAASSLLHSMCSISAPEGDIAARALVLSPHWHVLACASFAEAMLRRQSQASTFKCKVRLLRSAAEPTAVALACVVYSLKGIAPGAVLLQLTPCIADERSPGLQGMSAPVPVAWCLPARDAESDQQDQVCLLNLSCGPAAALEDSTPWLSSGVLVRSYFRQGESKPLLLRASFPAREEDLAASSLDSVAVLLRLGPPIALLGLWLADLPPTASSPLPRAGLAVAASELGPLLRLVRRDDGASAECVPALTGELLAELVRLDEAWAARLGAGAAQMLWRLEYGASLRRLSAL